MAKHWTEGAHQIGFNDDVVVGQRRLHVQTEVIIGSDLKIRTTVVERGAVRHVESGALAEPIDDIEHAREIVAARHRSVVHRVERGEIA